MTTRRQFCNAAGAGDFACNSHELGRSVPTVRTKIIGIGNAGWETVAILRERLPATTSIVTRTVNGALNPQHQFDYDFSPKFCGDNLSVVSHKVILADVVRIERLIQVADFSDVCAATLAYLYALKAREEGVKVLSLLISPYPRLWKDGPLPAQKVSRVVSMSDRIIQLDADSLDIPNHSDRPDSEMAEQVNAAAAEIVMDEIALQRGVGHDNAT